MNTSLFNIWDLQVKHFYRKKDKCMRKRKNYKVRNISQGIIGVIILICIAVFGYLGPKADSINTTSTGNIYEQEISFDLSTIPEYSSEPYVEINKNIPYFDEEDYTTEAFEKYSEWDSLGRSGVAFANICKETMPKDTEERGDIGSIDNLSGWVQKEYDGSYLYNRCHLIGWQLSAENANKENLITGTRYLNVEGMLYFENLVADYIKANDNNHVLYRVTPIYENDNKLASGVQMEAWSVEDNGKGLHFNVYCYNVQPGIVIDYKTGESYEKGISQE